MLDHVKFQPTKRLFIETITRDISIHDCILDLLDNAVDSYVRRSIKGSRRIELDFDKTRLSVFDNCGGISRLDLVNHVFRFGYLTHKPTHPTIGVYGIGLKRAIFKIGKRILFETDDGKEYSKFEIDVEAWKKANDDNWDVPLDDARPSKLKSGQLPYTSIVITSLNLDAKESLTAAFEERLKKSVAIYYSLFLQEGLNIVVNGQKQVPFEISLRSTSQSRPASITTDYQGIEIRIVCWIEAQDQKRVKMERGHRGWNVFMNRRLILPDDTTPTTGWSGNTRSELPKFHPIYNQFRGIVLLKCNDPSKLPLNTEKNGFNEESATYRYVVDQMIRCAKPVVEYLTNKYRKVKSEVDEAEGGVEDLLRNEPVLTGKYRTKVLTIDEVPPHSVFKAPPVPKSLSPTTVRIAYDKPAIQVQQLKKEFSVGSNKEVGSKSFDFAYKSLTRGRPNE